jgi:hypothetical protein
LLGGDKRELDARSEGEGQGKEEIFNSFFLAVSFFVISTFFLGHYTVNLKVKTLGFFLP